MSDADIRLGSSVVPTLAPPPMDRVVSERERWASISEMFIIQFGEMLPPLWPLNHGLVHELYRDPEDSKVCLTVWIGNPAGTASRYFHHGYLFDPSWSFEEANDAVLRMFTGYAVSEAMKEDIQRRLSLAYAAGLRR